MIETDYYAHEIVDRLKNIGCNISMDDYMISTRNRKKNVQLKYLVHTKWQMDSISDLMKCPGIAK